MKQIIVAGSINLDIVAKAPRHPKKGETLTGSDLQFNLGGKGANQAVAAAKLNEDGQTVLLGRIGNDPFGKKLLDELTGFGLLTRVSVDYSVPTGTALITLAQEDNTIVVIPGANGRFTQEEIDESIFGPGDVCVSQLEIPLPAVEGFFRTARQKGAICILNAAPAPAEGIASLLQLVDFLVVNETEAESMSSVAVRAANPDPIRVVANSLGLTNNQTLVITLGADGCVALYEDSVLKVPGRNVSVVDTTGAGDCFVGALATAMLRQRPLPEALRFANAAASICTTRMGAAHSMPSLDDVRSVLNA